MWHKTPTNDAWRSVTLASVAALGQHVWLRCNACGRDELVEPLEFAERTGIDPATPLLTIGRALKCSVCGERKGHCWPEPYAIRKRND
jgi:hypothetical protein